MATDPSKESQSKAILAWLLSGGELTALDAFRLFGCMRLSARIYDLINQGNIIHSEMIIVGGKRVKKYFVSHEASV